MLAKLTSKNQLTLPKSVTDQLGSVQYFDVQLQAGQVLLTPVRIQRGDAVRAKLAELSLDDQSIAAALAWGRSAAADGPNAASRSVAKPVGKSVGRSVARSVAESAPKRIAEQRSQGTAKRTAPAAAAKPSAERKSTTAARKAMNVGAEADKAPGGARRKSTGRNAA